MWHTHTFMSQLMRHEVWWLLQCQITLDGCYNATSYLVNVVVRYFNINFDEHHNAISTFIMSQCHKDIVVCHILTYTLMHVTIPHKHSWMSQCHANFDDIAMWRQLWWISQCDINFVECRNVTSTQGWMSQSDKDIVFCRMLTYTLMYVTY